MHRSAARQRCNAQALISRHGLMHLPLSITAFVLTRDGITRGALPADGESHSRVVGSRARPVLGAKRSEAEPACGVAHTASRKGSGMCGQ